VGFVEHVSGCDWPRSVFVSGCVALSGLGDLEIASDLDASPGLDGALSTPDGRVDGTTPGIDATMPRNDAGSPSDADATVDTGTKDTSVPDTSLPDTSTGQPDSAPITTNVGWTSFLSTGACSAADGGCSSGGRFTCDGTEDCAKGLVCCISYNVIALPGSSACASSCGATQAKACTGNVDCTTAGTSCQLTAGGPGIKSCQ